MSSRPDSAPTAGSLRELHTKALELLGFVAEKQPKVDQRKLSPDEFSHLRDLEAEVVAGCLVRGIPVPPFPDPADSGPFWEGCHRLGTLKIPYALMGLDNPKPMLLPTPDWFQAMRTFVLSLEMRANAADASCSLLPAHSPTPVEPEGISQSAGRPTNARPEPQAWGPFKPVKWWIERLVISEDTFARRRRDGTYREHPKSRRGHVSIALDDLSLDERASVKAAAPGPAPRTSPQ